MSGIKFLRYIDTPNCGQKGIVEIEFTTKILLTNNVTGLTQETPFVFIQRFKVVENADNRSRFTGMAAYKFLPEGPRNYLESFEVDSKTMDKLIKDFVLDHGDMNANKRQSIAQSSSIFTPNIHMPTLAQPEPVASSNSKQTSYDEAQLPF